MLHRDERSEVFIVVTFRGSVLVDMEVMDGPPKWKLWNSREGLTQRLWVANINGGDSLEITGLHTRLCDLLGVLNMPSKAQGDMLVAKLHLWLMGQNLHMNLSGGPENR